MGREVRRVPEDWEHPRNEKGFLVPLFGRGFAKCLRDWNEDNAQWERGLERDWGGIGDKKAWKMKPAEYRDTPFSEYGGSQPRVEEYMPEWPDAERTHYQMYETTTEGTPISPVFASPEQLARWLVDNEASAFGEQVASYNAWLKVCKDGWAPTAVMRLTRDGPSGLVSGVEGMRLQEVRDESASDG